MTALIPRSDVKKIEPIMFYAVFVTSRSSSFKYTMSVHAVHAGAKRNVCNTVKTLYNVTHYNRIFNRRHKIAGNGSVSIIIPSLLQNIHITTPTVTSGNRYTISIENKFIKTEFLLCVRQFGDQNKVFLHEQVSVSLDKWEALCILMQYEAELMYTYGIIAF